MTTYRLLDGGAGRPGIGSTGTQPPATVTSASGGWLLGTQFTLTQGMRWLDGYWFWCPSNGDTGPQKFALWNVYANATQALIPGSVVTSGTLTQSTFNFVPLPQPIQLAPGELYTAVTGWNVTNGIPLTAGQFASGQPYHAGITNGPLYGWSNTATGGTTPFPWATQFGMGQGLFSNVLGSDPTVAMPNNSSGSDLFWVDVQIDDTPPAGFSGSYRLRPNATAMTCTSNTIADTATNFTLAVEFSLTVASTSAAIWFYSPPGTTQLPTELAIWQVTGQVLVGHTAAPNWSGAAGSGWVRAPLTAALQAGINYKAAVFNGAAIPVIWNDAITDFWSASDGFGSGGLTAGPLAFPDTTKADTPGQASYNASTSLHFPDTNVGPFDYGVDIEVIPPAAVVQSGSWWGLDTVLKEAMEYQAYYRAIPPVACPFDGEPLRQGPPQSPSVLYCPWGNYEYPRDWDPDRDSGM